MDHRYLLGAVAMTIALGAWEYIYGYNGAAALVYPFALIILLFFWVLGESPSKKTDHWVSERAVR